MCVFQSELYILYHTTKTMAVNGKKQIEKQYLLLLKRERFYI